MKTCLFFIIFITFEICSNSYRYPSKFFPDVSILTNSTSLNLSQGQAEEISLNSFFKGFNLSFSDQSSSPNIELKIKQNNISSISSENLANLTNYIRINSTTMMGFDISSGNLFFGQYNDQGFPIFNRYFNITNGTNVVCADLLRLSDSEFVLDCMNQYLQNIFYVFYLQENGVEKKSFIVESNSTSLDSRYIKLLKTGNSTFIVRSQYGLDCGSISNPIFWINNSFIEVFSYTKENISLKYYFDNSVFNTSIPLSLIALTVDGNEIFMIDNFYNVGIISILDGNVSATNWTFPIPFLSIQIDSNNKEERLLMLAGPIQIQVFNVKTRRILETYNVSECDDMIRGFDFNENFIVLLTSYWDQSWNLYSFLVIYHRNSSEIYSYYVPELSLFSFDKQNNSVLVFGGYYGVFVFSYYRLMIEKNPKIIINVSEAGYYPNNWAFALSSYKGASQSAEAIINLNVTEDIKKFHDFEGIKKFLQD